MESRKIPDFGQGGRGSVLGAADRIGRGRGPKPEEPSRWGLACRVGGCMPKGTLSLDKVWTRMWRTKGGQSQSPWAEGDLGEQNQGSAQLEGPGGGRK